MSNQCGSTLTPILSNRKRKAAKEELSIVLSKKARFYSTFFRQSFSLPNSIIFCICKNPKSAAIYQKLIKTCKYFFAKNPLIIIIIKESNDQWEVCNKVFGFKNLTCKIWITEEVFMDLYEPKCAPRLILSSIIPQIFRCDVQNLTIMNQDITLNDLSLLLSSAEFIAFDNVIVKDENNSIVGVEKIVEVVAAKNAKSFNIIKPTITPSTLKEISKISFSSKFDHFSMKDIPETFDLEAFSIFMKKNKTITFVLEFDPSISESYKIKLEAIIDEILSTKVLTCTFKPPKIYFYGNNDEKHQKLCEYFYQPLKIDKNAAVCFL